MEFEMSESDVEMAKRQMEKFVCSFFNEFVSDRTTVMQDMAIAIMLFSDIIFAIMVSASKGDVSDARRDIERSSEFVKRGVAKRMETIAARWLESEKNNHHGEGPLH